MGERFMYSKIFCETSEVRTFKRLHVIHKCVGRSCFVYGVAFYFVLEAMGLPFGWSRAYLETGSTCAITPPNFSYFFN